MALLHFLQGAAVLFLAKDFRLPVNVSFLTFDHVRGSLVPDVHKVGEIPLALLVVTFLLVSSIAHLIISTIYKKSYQENLGRGINKARWVEYSISASIMMVAIAMLVGIYDLGTLLCLLALVAGMNLMGLLMEIHNQSTNKTNWLSYWIGCFLGAVPWIVIAIYFYGSVTYGTGDIPAFVYWIYVSLFLFFNCFALNIYLQYRKIGPWKDYLFGEKVYIILSLIAKSALAWQVFAGTLRP